MTTTHPNDQQISNLIGDLARRYVAHPQSIDVRFQRSLDGSVYFALQGDPKDAGRLIGSEHTHADAMALLVKYFGRVQSRTFTFRLITIQERASKPSELYDVISYDTAQDKEILDRLLNALDVDGTVEVGPGTGPRKALSFEFIVNVKHRIIAENLTLSVQGLSIIGAIGTLYRAIAKSKGVRFNVRLADRTS